MKHLLFVTFLFFSLSVSAQDVIVKKDGSTILSKVLEVNVADIKYKKFSNLNGPTYTITKSEIMSINYENGEKDDFCSTHSTSENTDIKGTSQGMIIKSVDKRNDEILALYNKIYQPSNKVSIKDKNAWYCMVIIGVKAESVMSNEDVEMKLIRKIIENPHDGGYKEQRYFINIANKTNKTIYIDKGNCFRLNSKGEAFCYYNNSEQITASQGGGSGGSIGLGSVAGALGIGGVAGQLAGGVNIGGGTSHNLSKTYSQQRVIAIPPHGNQNLVEDRWYKSEGGVFLLGIHASYDSFESSEDFSFCDNYHLRLSSIECGIKKGDINRGQVKIFGEDELPWKKEYYLTYSTDENFQSYSTLNAKLYIHEIIGDAGDMWEDRNNYKYIDGMNDYTINGTLILEKEK